MNMKPYDPEHKGDFCTWDGKSVTLWDTKLRGVFPLAGVVHSEDVDAIETWTKDGRFRLETEHPIDLMCVIPKSEARVRYVDELDFAWEANESGRWETREVMPDDISQEKARAVIEAAREVVSLWKVGAVSRIDDLRAALGDDA